MSPSQNSAAVRADSPAQEAIPRLLDLYGDKLYRLGVHQCGDPDEAHDLVQDTFTTAYRKWDQFEGRSAPSSWLYTIAVRICRRRHRRRAGEPRHHLSLDDLLPGQESPVAVVPDDSDPLASVLRREARERVASAITRLPAHYRMPLLLKEIAELSIEEVAQILDLQPATVKTRLHRARLMLRKEVESLLPTADLPTPDHSRQICLDLLRAKQEAIDHGVELSIADDELCARCRALFATLELTQSACRALRSGDELPAPIRRLVMAEIGDEPGETAGTR